MTIGIIGSGSIGLLLASYLQLADHEVKLFTQRKQQADVIQKEGIHLLQDQRSIHLHTRIQANSFLEWNPGKWDCVFIAVKQYQLDHVLSVLSRTVLSCPVILVLNGMGHVEKAERYLGNTPLYASVVTHGAKRITDNQVRHTGVGECKIGSLKGMNGELDSVIYRLDQAGFTAKSEVDITRWMREKLVVNAVINPLTALYRVENGALLSNEFYYENAKAVYIEIKNVITPVPRWEQVEDIIRKTSKNHSSMYEDIRLKRRTEIDAITGYILDKGEEQGHKLPIVSFLHESVKGLERGSANVR
ncbi:2-dehydropantoate 2-reductase [Alteribacter populi]|uniref:2-dehydropantoate 2-reductase n=1 Tax=Alteribacter populi TaxID=2011011 RepID=UPI0012FD74D3|nr:2-dehydropantoate 2-reductase [Alteribacter populi]